MGVFDSIVFVGVYYNNVWDSMSFPFVGLLSII